MHDVGTTGRLESVECNRIQSLRVLCGIYGFDGREGHGLSHEYDQTSPGRRLSFTSFKQDPDF